MEDCTIIQNRKNGFSVSGPKTRLYLAHCDIRGNNEGTFLFEKNLLKGPLPSTLKNLKNLKDFHIFDSYPSRMILSPRGFLRKKFECDFDVLPGLGIQCVCWDEVDEEEEEENVEKLIDSNR